MRSAAPMPRSRMDEGARRIAVGRDGRTHSGMLEAALIRGLTEGGDRRRCRSAWGLARCSISRPIISTSTAASRSPAATIRPTTTASSCCSKAARCSAQEIQALGQPRRRRRLERGAGTVEEVDIREAYANRLLEGFSGKPFRIGWDAGNGAAGPILDMLVDRLPGQHFAIFTEVDGTLPQPPPRPDGREEPRRPQAARRRQAARLRNCLRRRWRPHRRGRRQGPGDLGRPAADDPCRAGARGSSPARPSSPT